MPLIPYPNVPPLPGVPALSRSNNAKFVGAALNIAGQLLPNNLFGQTYSIIDDTGTAVLVPNSFISFEYRQEAKVPFYPIEQGGFQGYNKVQMPAEIRVTCAVTGIKSGILQSFDIFKLNGATPMSKTDFIKAVNKLITSASVLTINTPNKNFSDYTLTHFDYRQEAKSGAIMLIAQLYFQQIISVPTTTKTTSDPSGANPQSNGQVSTSDVATNQPTQVGGAVTAKPL
jgi:hypothetical protein